ncbi:hypothetical protein DL98DRAFT_534993 [Cadophora sp. DSE1049]|nr:hypothetical protein DL98DRAFT_534993 [Cadophora sp. DSE1049]
MASPVWHKFLSPPWMKSDDPPVTEIDFSEDDGAALLILLRIVHYQLPYIPKTVDLMTSYNIAVLCEQYDCLHMISPWVKRWQKCLKDNEDQPDFRNAMEHKVYIYWALGDIPSFKRLAMRIVCRSGLDGDVLDSLDISREILPEGLYACRIHTENTVVNDSEATGYTICRGWGHCDLFTFGSFTLNLMALELWPRKQPQDIKISVNRLSELLRHFGVARLGDDEDHGSCGGDSYEKNVTQVLDNVPDPTLECHMRHMKSRHGIVFPGNAQNNGYPQCIRCSTCHSTVQECPPNPRKRPAE